MDRNQRWRLDCAKIVKFGPCLPTNLDHVLESRSGDQRHPGATALEDDVGGERGAVDGGAHLARRDAALVEQAVDALLDAVSRILRRGEDLADAQCARALVHEHEVGERSADVDAQPCRHERKFTIRGAVILSAIGGRAIVPKPGTKGGGGTELYPTTVNVVCSPHAAARRV